mmetsp:Transcript_10530/g.33368  ORF Transcript_10530/g.33368 Transcript_10530/m.33368 type:complete len:246 (-) Transcript_10530:1661-2398(-)
MRRTRRACFGCSTSWHRLLCCGGSPKCCRTLLPPWLPPCTVPAQRGSTVDRRRRRSRRSSRPLSPRTQRVSVVLRVLRWSLLPSWSPASRPRARALCAVSLRSSSRITGAMATTRQNVALQRRARKGQGGARWTRPPGGRAAHRCTAIRLAIGGTRSRCLACVHSSARRGMRSSLPTFRLCCTVRLPKTGCCGRPSHNLTKTLVPNTCSGGRCVASPTATTRRAQRATGYPSRRRRRTLRSPSTR